MGSNTTYDPDKYEPLKPANTTQGLQDAAYRVQTAVEKQSGRKHYFLDGKDRISSEDGVAISAGRDRPARRAVSRVFSGVDFDAEGNIIKE